MPELASDASASVREPHAQDALAILEKGSRTFAFAGRFLPAATRADAALLYAFCRYVDDLADEATDAAQAERALDRVIAEVQGDAVPRPFLVEIRTLFTRCAIDPATAVALARGVRLDLAQVRIADDRALLRYAYAVASTVGVMMCGVLGVRDRAALAFAIDLGLAMQITNICRDVREDAERGRVYLPATRLAHEQVPSDPAAILGAREAVAHVVSDLLARADALYASAEHGMRYLPFGARLAILVAARVYREIGVLLRERACDALAGRTVVPTWRKVRVALAALPALLVLGWRRQPHDPALHDGLAGLPGADCPADASSIS